MDSLTAKITAGVSWTARDSLFGGAYGDTVNETVKTRQVSYVSTIADAALGGAKELYSTILTITGGTSTTLDLEALVNILGAAIDFARIKAIVIRLLSTTDDAVNGTAASSISVGNAAANAFTSQSGTGWLQGATHLIDIPNGGGILFWTNNAGGIAVDATHSDLKILNNDGAVAAKVEVTLIGGTA